MGPGSGEGLREALLALAVDRLDLGDLATADMAAREVLDLAPDDPDALSIIGAVAGRVGLRDQAVAAISRTVELLPGFLPAVQNLAQARALPAQPEPAPAPRFLLIKAWGYGFWSEVENVLAGLLLAEATGRIPVVHWGKNSLFNDHPQADGFIRFFEPVSDMALDDLIAARPAGIFPPKWTLENLREEDFGKWQGEGAGLRAIYLLSRPEALVVSDFHNHVIDILPWLPASHPLHGRSAAEAHADLIRRYLRPTADLLAEIEAFAAANLSDRPFIAVHARGSDKVGEDPYIDDVHQSYFARLDREDPRWGVFLLSEDARLVEAFKARYGERLVLTEAQRTNTIHALHHHAKVDRERLGREVIIDTYLALRCERFLGNGRSNLSAMIAELKDWPPGACTLIGPSSLRWRWVRTMVEAPPDA